MHITSVEIENIKSIQKLRWEVPAGQEAGWHVIIGDNGSGKTTFLQAVALGLLGPQSAEKLLQDFRKWRTTNSEYGKVILEIQSTQSDPSNLENGRVKSENSEVGLFWGTKKEFLSWGRKIGWSFADGAETAGINGSEFLQPMWEENSPSGATLWNSLIMNGWFSASFGPLRRFSGGDSTLESYLEAFPKVSRHSTLFLESISLKDGLKWLTELRSKQLEERGRGELLDRIKQFVNQDDFLPNNVKMAEVMTDKVIFTDSGNCNLLVLEMSDGYRSILSLTFELLRQLSRAFPVDSIFDKTDTSKIIAPGVVLIDEVDAHLHPTWQRKIGQWFRKYFPNMQFIVTTHSPLICQAAEHGTVFRLPRPGTDETGRMIVDDELNRLVYGNVLDAYGTELFGKDVTSSDASKAKRVRLAELNRKELRKGLTAKERKEQDELRTMLPTSAHTMNGGKG
jgi:predicted ATPase